MVRKSPHPPAVPTYPETNTLGLEREEFITAEDLCDQGSVLELARKNYDYIGPATTKAMEKMLAGAGVKPFTQASVDRYKNRAGISNLVLLGAYVALLVSAISGLVWAVSDVPKYSPFLLFTFGALFPILIRARKSLISAPTTLWQRLTTMFEWRLDFIKNYHLPVPEFALQTANDICKVYEEQKPGFEHRPIFAICYLAAAQNKLADPFLAVTTATSVAPWYYIEVWNEPKFQQERIA